MMPTETHVEPSGSLMGEADGGHDALELSVTEACAAVGEFIEYWGFKATHGRVWMLLALSREPMAQKQLGEALSLSRGTISTVVSDLVERGLIRAVTDHRNAPYIALTDFWPTIASVLREREWRLISRAHGALLELARELELRSARGEVSAYDLGRVTSLVNLTEMAQRVLQLLIAVPMPSHGERVRSWFSTVSRVARRLRRTVGH